jgi:hypothetical protein
MYFYAATCIFTPVKAVPVLFLKWPVMIWPPG